MFLYELLNRRRLEAPASAVYRAIVTQAREAGFYRVLSVDDTPEGRFEMIALHAFLVLNRLKGHGHAGAAADRELAQALFDVMFADMDRNLREMGTGDLGVARRVKGLAQAFYGRIAAYERGIEGGCGALAEALERNVFGGKTRGDSAALLAGYMLDSLTILSDLPLERIQAGRLSFAPLPIEPAAPITAGSET